MATVADQGGNSWENPADTLNPKVVMPDLAQMLTQVEQKAMEMNISGIENLSPGGIRGISHELQALRIKLEMHNEYLRQVQTELIESRARYSSLFDTAPVGFCTLSQQGIVLEANLAAAALLGVARDGLLGQPLLQFIPPEDQEIYHRHRRDLFETRQPQVCELRMRKSDGTTVWTHVDAAATLDAKGRPACCFTIRDMTDRKRVEEGLREQAALLDAANDAIIVRTLDQRVVYWNTGAERLYGWTSAEVVGCKINEWERATSAELEAARAVLFSEGYWSGELEESSKTGKKLTVFCRFTLLRDGNGQPDRYLAITTDVSEKKQLEAEFFQSQKLETVGRLAGGVAHDFNNLLTVILGCTNFLLQDLPPGSMRSDVEQIKEAGEQAVLLIRQLLAFSRKQIIQPKNLNLNELVSEMGRMLSRLLGEDVDLLVVPGSRLGLIKADPGQIQQVIINLAVNARDAMPFGGKLTIETNNIEIDRGFIAQHPTVLAGSYVMLAISDNGIGMDERTQAHIFEPFFTTKGPGKRSGLGLPTVYGIVNQSNGFIWVGSEQGKGTMFRICFPRVEDTD
jgi:two-component system, cell cycle sensor histidine kinase and response regulator CckA